MEDIINRVSKKDQSSKKYHWLRVERGMKLIAVHDKQVVIRHNKHQVIGVGKEIEISST